MTSKASWELLALADAYEAGTAKVTASAYEEFGPKFQRERKLIVEALRAYARSDVPSAAQPVHTAEGVRQALERSERSFEFIRMKLIDKLGEPERSAFWAAVESRDVARSALAWSARAFGPRAALASSLPQSGDAQRSHLDDAERIPVVSRPERGA